MASHASPAAMLIVADDLSGAADCGIACTMAGLDTVVLLDEAAAAVRADAVAVDTSTRRKPAAEAFLAAGHDTVIRLGSDGAVDLADGLSLCRGLAALVAPCVHRIGALVATGGETARAVLLAFGTRQLRLVGELEAGVPIGLANGSRSLPVITKAGAFGHPDTLLRCRATLRSGITAGRTETS